MIELLEGESFEGFGRGKPGEFVVYDRLYNGVIATVTKTEEHFLVTTTTWLDSQGTAANLKDAARIAGSLVVEEVRLATGDWKYCG